MRDLRALAADGRARRPLRAARGGELVDVCALCEEEALETGWLKEGAPTTPLVADDRRRRSALDLARSSAPRRAPDAPVATEPILRRLSDEELAMVEAADLFNGSQFRRTIGGVAKSLGEPQASIVSFSGVEPGARGHDRLGHLVVPVPRHIRSRRSRSGSRSAGTSSTSSTSGIEVWNAHVEEGGRLVPDIARI